MTKEKLPKYIIAVRDKAGKEESYTWGTDNKEDRDAFLKLLRNQDELDFIYTTNND